MARGDGKTTRQIQKAIQRARDGARVLYITRGPTSYYMGLAHRLAPDGKVSETRREVLMPHGASIRFVEDVMLRWDRVAGWLGVAVIDHAAHLDKQQWPLLRHPNIEIDTSVPEVSRSTEQKDS